jgi:starvation-inducible DNA-binding protein
MQSTECLSKLLADTYLLYLKTQSYHWNVEGPRFFMLHKLWEMQYEELANAIDDIAERIRKLGHKVSACMTDFLDLTRLKDSQELKGEDAMLRDLGKNHAQLISFLRADIKTLQETSDEGTVDFMIGRLRAHEKMHWMLNTHLRHAES